MSDMSSPGQGLRTDLVAGDGTYGSKAEQSRQLEAVPASPPPNLSPPPALMGPSSNAGEPVQAGLPMGPGAGPEVLPQGGGELTEAVLRQLYQKFPSPTILSLIEKAQRG